MPRFILLPVIILGLISSIKTGAQNAPAPKTTVSAAGQNVSIAKALELLFANAGGAYRYTPRTEATLKDMFVTFSLTNVPFETAVNSILKSAGAGAITYEVVKGVYVFQFHSTQLPSLPQNGVSPPARPIPNPRKGHVDKKISIHFNNMTLPDALRALFEVSGASYASPRLAVPGDKIKVFEAVDTPFENVLGRLLSLAKISSPLEFEVHWGLYMIGRGHGPPPPPFGNEPERGPVKIDLHMNDADLRYAIKALFLTIPTNYSLDQNVVGKVTVDVQNADLKTAIHMVLKAARPTKPYSVEFADGTYRIGLAAPGAK